MAKAFNLTAQINLQGPTNIRPIVSNIKKQFSNIKADLKLNIDPKANTKIASITKGIQTLTASVDTATISINKLNIGLTTLGSSLGKIQSISGTVNSSIGKVSTSSKSAAKAAREAATEIQAFGDAAGLALKRFAAFSAVSTVIYGLVNSINDAVGEFIAYDRELIRLTQVTGGAISQFGGLSVGVQEISNEVRRLSTTLGVSSQELIKVASTLAQAGLTASETKIALEALAKSALAPSFENITQTTEGAIAAIRQFGLGVGELETALGSINQVAADFAVESDDIIKAIQRTGGVFASASRGVSSGTDALNQFIAVFTSVRATTRESAETIATGLRTIFTRIQRSTTVKALKELGVELRDSQGKFVGAFEAVKRLSEGLSSIDPRSGTFAEIIEELGGFRQIGKVIPLIQEFETAQKAYQSAQRGSNSLAKASEVGLYSLENQLARTREEFIALIAEFANTGTVKAFTITTLGLARGFISVVGALKPLLPLITTLATIKLSQKIPEFIGGRGQVGFLSGLFKGSAGTLAAPTTATPGATQAPIAVSSNTQAINLLTAAIKNLTTVIQTRPGRTGFATGGLVSGVGSRDTVPAMLTPGEFVIRKKAVESIGAGNLQNINRYALGGPVSKKGSELINLYPSLKKKGVDPDGVYSANIDPKIINSQNLSVIGNMVKNKRQKPSLNNSDNFEQALSQAYRLILSTIPNSYLDFPKKPGDAKFLKEGDTNRRNDLRGNNNETMLAKLLGAGSYKPGNANNVSVYYPANPKQIEGIVKSYTIGPNKNRDRYGKFKFANGGSVKDTVPALLTPGEFVIQKDAAQKLGSATLHRMNNADKLQGYNRGGFVGGGTPIQKFADGDFVPSPLNKTSPGNIEAYIQKILMSLEKATKAAEKQTYEAARASGQSAKEAVKLAKQAGIEAAKKEASRLTTAVTTRGGPTQYTEKAQIEAARKRMIAAINTGKDPSVKGATERRRTPGYLEREKPKPILEEPTTTASETTTELSESNTEASETVDKFNNRLTNTILIFSNAIIPQLKSFADSIKMTDSALGAAAAQAAEMGASLALSASLGLQAVNADKKTIARATVGAGLAGAVGGGLQAFVSQSIENAIKENSKSLSSFNKTLTQIKEAPTLELQVQAAAELDKEFTKLSESALATTEAISEYEWWEKLGKAVTDSTSTYLALSTSLIAVQQSALAASAAMRTQAAVNTASTTSTSVSTALEGASAAGGIAIGALLAKFNIFLQIGIAAISVFSTVWSIFSRSTGRATEQLDKFGKALENTVKNSNNYSLANKRFTGVILEEYRRLQANLDQLPTKERKRVELEAFGGSKTVNQVGRVIERPLASGLNQFNLLLDQFIRAQLAQRGVNVGTEQSIRDKLVELLDAGSTTSVRTLQEVITDLRDPTSKLSQEFEKSAYIQGVMSQQQLTVEQAEAAFNKASQDERARVAKEYIRSVNQEELARKSLIDSTRKLQVSSLNFIDILNRVNASLKKISIETSNAFDDALYSLELFTSETPRISANTEPARQAEILRNSLAADTDELQSAVTSALKLFDLNQSIVVPSFNQATGQSGTQTVYLEEFANQLRGNMLALQIAEKEIPIALRSFAAERQAGGSVESLEATLEKFIKPIGLSPSDTKTILDELVGGISKSLEGEGTKSLDELISQFPSLVKNQDSFRASLDTLSGALDAASEVAKRNAEIGNAMATTLQKVTGLQIQAAQLRLNTELEIAQITGRRSGLRELNAPFDAAINKLTESIGGTADPAQIVAGIEATAKQIQEARKQNKPAEEQARLVSGLTSLQQALSMLGDKNQRLTNALDKLRQVEEERKGVGNIFQQMIKASTDPIARMDIEDTFAAAARVRAGGTNSEDVIRTLEKFIPMLEASGGRYAEAAAKFKDEILSRSARVGAQQALETGDILTYLRGLDLARFLQGGITQKAEQRVQNEVGVANKAIEAKIGLSLERIGQTTTDTNNIMSEFRDKFANVWPKIINEMETFRAELNRINSEQNAINLSKPTSDLTDSYSVINKSLQVIADAAAFQERTLTTTGLPAGMFSGRSQIIPQDMRERYFERVPPTFFERLIGDVNKLRVKKQIDMSSLNIDQLLRSLQDAIDITKTSNPNLSRRLTVERESLSREREKFIKLMESRKEPSSPSMVPKRSNQFPAPSPSPALNQQPMPSPTPQPVGGGAFNIPPEQVRSTAQTPKTKLDFDYNDFIIKFNRAFDVQTGKFREAVSGLSLSFQALNPPVDKFSSSVTKLIEGLNAINDAGGIKGPNIPEKVTVEVVFNEDLTIDTSRINNNDLLNQIGVITSQAINERIEALKLTGK